MKKIITFIFTLFFCTTVFAEDIKQLVVIGDSLSDNGNLYKKLFQIIPKSPPYYAGRFSNGPTWAENLGQYFYSKKYIDYKIVAYGGATAILHNLKDDKFIAPVTLDGEMFEYYAGSLFTDKSKVLYAFWISSNDYLYDEQENLQGLVNDVVEKTIASVEGLAKRGAKNFIILNEPDLARTPFARNHKNAERLHSLTILHNKKLAEEVNNLNKKYPKAKFVLINIYDIFNDLLDNTDKFNKKYNQHITNITDSCWLGSMTLQQKALAADMQKLTLAKQKTLINFDTNAIANWIQSSPTLSMAYNTSRAMEDGLTPCNHAEEYVFWDELHPTAVVHSILGQIVAETWEKG